MSFFQKNKVLLILFFAAFVLRLIPVFAAAGIATDGCSYIRLAEDILKGDFGRGVNAYLPPLFPILIAGASFIFGNLEISARMVSCLAGSLTVFPLFFLIRDIFDRKVAVVTVICYMFHPYLLRASGEVLTEAMYAFIITSLAWILWKAIRSRKLILFVFVGLLVLLAMLTRPEGIAIILLIFGWIWIPNLLKIKKELCWKFSASFLFILVYIIALLPFYLHFYRTSGNWRPTLRHIPFVDDRIEDERWSDMLERVLRGKISNNVPDLLRAVPEAYYPSFIIFLLFGLIKRRSYKGFRAGEGFILSFILYRIFIITVFAGVTDRYFYCFVPMALSWAAVGFWEINDRFLLIPKIKTYQIGQQNISKALAIFMLIVLSAGFPEGFRPIRLNRVSQKKAGLWLRENAIEKEYTVAACSPQEAFYAGAEFYPIQDGNYAEILKQVRENDADFLIYDKEIEVFCPDFRDSVQENDFEVFSLEFESTDRKIVIYKVVK